MDLNIIIDNRERNIELISALEDSGVKARVASLPVGDYIISDRVCIERKTIHDFENSLINGRLFDQIKRIKEHYSAPIILIEGSKEEFRLKNNVIMGAMAYLYIDNSIQVITSWGPKESADIIATIARHEQHPENREPSLKGGARAYSDAQFQEYIIGNLPGVGPKLAKSLLTHFKSIRNLANSNVEELMEVEKIGKKKAEKIFALMNRDY